jgi:hypothetical protein
MNKLEAAYAEHLEQLLRAGLIAFWKWDCLSLKLAKNTHYRTDFLVMQTDGCLEVHETKGNHMEEDAWLKLKMVAELFPFPVMLVRKDKAKGWDIAEVQLDAKGMLPRKPKPEVVEPKPQPPGPTWPKG